MRWAARWSQCGSCRQLANTVPDSRVARSSAPAGRRRRAASGPSAAPRRPGIAEEAAAGPATHPAIATASAASASRSGASAGRPGSCGIRGATSCRRSAPPRGPRSLRHRPARSGRRSPGSRRPDAGASTSSGPGPAIVSPLVRQRQRRHPGQDVAGPQLRRIRWRAASHSSGNWLLEPGAGSCGGAAARGGAATPARRAASAMGARASSPVANSSEAPMHSPVPTAPPRCGDAAGQAAPIAGRHRLGTRSGPGGPARNRRRARPPPGRR